MVVQLLTSALLLGSGPSSLSDAMPYHVPFETSGSGEALPNPSEVWGSGELQEPDSWVGTASGDGDGDQLVPLSERSPMWAEGLGDEEPEIGSGDDSTSLPTQTIVTKLRSDEVVPFILKFLQQNEDNVVELQNWVPEIREEEAESDIEEEGKQKDIMPDLIILQA